MFFLNRNPHFPYNSAFEEMIDYSRMVYAAIKIGCPAKHFDEFMGHCVRIRRLTMKALIEMKKKPKPKPKPGGGYGNQEEA